MKPRLRKIKWTYKCRRCKEKFEVFSSQKSSARKYCDSCARRVVTERAAAKKKRPTNPCWFCRSEMIWGGDHTAEDHGRPGDGIVANLSCSNKDCNATALFYTGDWGEV